MKWQASGSKNGYDYEALEHYLSAENFVHALRLLEKMIPLLPNYEWTALHRWLNRISNSELLKKPTFFLMNITSLYSSGHIHDATNQYWWAVDKLESNPGLSQNEKRQFEAGLNFLVAFRSFLEKDFESFIEYAKKYLEQDPEGGFLPDFDIEHDGYHPNWDIYLSSESESLYEAEDTLQTLLDMWSKTKNKLFFAHLCLDYGRLLYERNRLKEAEQHAYKAWLIGKEYDIPSLMVRASLVMAEVAVIDNREKKQTTS